MLPSRKCAIHLQLALTGLGLRCCAGRILNRFSSDTATADDSLPFIANLLLANLAALTGVLLVLAYTQPLLTLLVVPLGVAYLNLQASKCLPLLIQALSQIVQHSSPHTILRVRPFQLTECGLQGVPTARP